MSKAMTNPGLTWMAPRVAAALLVAGLSACEPQTPVNTAPPEAITAPPPAANPQPDVNAKPVEFEYVRAEAKVIRARLLPIAL